MRVRAETFSSTPSSSSFVVLADEGIRKRRCGARLCVCVCVRALVCVCVLVRFDSGMLSACVVRPRRTSSCRRSLAARCSPRLARGDRLALRPAGCRTACTAPSCPPAYLFFRQPASHYSPRAPSAVPRCCPDTTAGDERRVRALRWIDAPQRTAPGATAGADAGWLRAVHARRTRWRATATRRVR